MVCDTAARKTHNNICLLAVVTGTFSDNSPELFDTVLEKLRRQQNV
jgi:hypothetical protein